MTNTLDIRLWVFPAALIMLTAWLAAQQKPVIVPIAQMGTGQQVNTGLYGTGTSGSIRYSTGTSNAMQSELRQAYWQSGALPSDVKMGYASLGPMTAGGAIDYIPGKPSYLSKSSAPVASISPAGGGAYSAGSVRYAPSYSTPSASAPMVMPRSVSAGPINPGPVNAGPLNSGAIRYPR